MFQLGFELSYPRLEASIHPLPSVLPFLSFSKLRYFLDNFGYIYSFFQTPYLSTPFFTLPRDHYMKVNDTILSLLARRI